MPIGRVQTVWLTAAVALWCFSGSVISSQNNTSSLQHINPITSPTYTPFNTINNPKPPNLLFQRDRRRPFPRRIKRNYLKPNGEFLLSLISAANKQRNRRQDFNLPLNIRSRRITDKHVSSQQYSLKRSNPLVPNKELGQWITKRSGQQADTPSLVNNQQDADSEVKEKEESSGQEEISKSLQQVGSGIGRAFFRNARNAPGMRIWDVPQIECPAAVDMERFPCPSPDHMGRYRCIDEHLLCDGFIDCPVGEDEDREQCMFYKMTKAHLDILADAIIRWARGGK